MNEPTPRQSDVLDFTAKYQTDHNGRSPTIREIAAGLDLTSTNSVYQHLCKLRDKGLLTWEPGQVRTLTIVKQ